MISLVLAMVLLASPDAASSAVDAGVQGDASVGDAADAGTPMVCPDLAILQAAGEADLRLRQSSDCAADDLGKLTAALKMLDACTGKTKPAKSWVFPVANVTPGESIGGVDGSGFIRNPHVQCYVTPGAGHPAQDLFVDDVHQVSRDKNGNMFSALAIEDSWVVVARDGWQPGDDSKGGNYVMLYLPGRKQIAYYAHLETLAVKPGDRLAAGKLVGTIGRTGRNAAPARSQTHLHFGLWDVANFRPVNSFPLLRYAKTAKVAAATAP